MNYLLEAKTEASLLYCLRRYIISNAHKRITNHYHYTETLITLSMHEIMGINSSGVSKSVTPRDPLL